MSARADTGIAGARARLVIEAIGTHSHARGSFRQVVACCTAAAFPVKVAVAVFALGITGPTHGIGRIAAVVEEACGRAGRKAGRAIVEEPANIAAAAIIHGASHARLAGAITIGANVCGVIGIGSIGTGGYAGRTRQVQAATARDTRIGGSCARGARRHTVVALLICAVGKVSVGTRRIARAVKQVPITHASQARGGRACTCCTGARAGIARSRLGICKEPIRTGGHTHPICQEVAANTAATITAAGAIARTSARRAQRIACAAQRVGRISGIRIERIRACAKTHTVVMQECT